MIENNYQIDIFKKYETTNKNIFVSANPGSGKTTVIKELSNRTSPSKKQLFLAYNKSIANELESKLPYYAECSTMHSKGMKVLLKHFKVKPKLVENKTFKVGMEILKFPLGTKEKDKIKILFELQDIYNLMRMNVVEDVKCVQRLCFDYGIECPTFYLQMLEKLQTEIEKRNKKKLNGTFNEFDLDFTDMLWIPYKYVPSVSFPKYDVVFIDEVQDLNWLQKELILRYVKKGGRFIAVGDERQNIYSFGGANLGVLKSFETHPNTESFPLGITYRCAKEIVEEAKKVFPEVELESLPNSEGKVRDGNFLEAKENDFILCRNNLPLVEVFILLLEEGKRSFIMGRDFGEMLLKLVQDVNKIIDLDEKLFEKLNKLKEDLNISEEKALKQPSYLKLDEQVKIIKRLYSKFGSMDEVKRQLLLIYKDTPKSNEIILSTIHKSKGLESERVFILNKELIPSPYAESEMMLYSEHCLLFVAITRAKKELIYCNV